MTVKRTVRREGPVMLEATSRCTIRDESLAHPGPCVAKVKWPRREMGHTPNPEVNRCRRRV